MREIKFRGMGINGEWHCGFLSVVSDKRAGIPLGSYISNAVGMPFAYAVRPETIGQFTGLTDRGGKEIYEGDAVLWKGWDKKEYKAPIAWDRDMCRFVFKFKDGVWKTFGSEYSVEIIGNIHERPHFAEMASEQTNA